MKYSRFVTIASLAFGLLVASTMLYIGFRHNAQGEFIHMDTRLIDWQYSGLLFVTWFAFISIVSALVLIAARVFLALMWMSMNALAVLIRKL